jgi:hypothetical protein
MDHEHSHGHEVQATRAPGDDMPYFPASVWERLHADDRYGATVIVLLMCGIFTIGLLLYAGIAYWVSTQR